MSGEFNHYKPHPKPEFFEDWALIPPGMTDEILIELMKPLEPLYIRRSELGAAVRYLCRSYGETDALQAKLRAWSEEYEAVETERRRREYADRFAKYLESLNLDAYIEIPMIYHYTDGTQSEYTTKRIKV